MGKRKRKKINDRVTDFLNDALVQVYTQEGMVAELTLAVSAREPVGILSVSKKADVNDVYLVALFSVLRDALQERVMHDIGRAGDFVQRVSADDASQLELTDADGRSIKGFIPDVDDDPPF